MAQNNRYGVYGYRFHDGPAQPLFRLFAVGFEDIRHRGYDWDGMKRIDGPLYLFQYTVAGLGRVELDGRAHDVPPGTAFLVDIPGRHRYYLPEDSERWSFYFVLFRQRHLQPLWEHLRAELGPLPRLGADSPAIRRLREMYAEARLDGIKDGYYASSLVYGFLMELARGGAAQRRERSGWPEIVRRAAAYIERDFRTLEGLDDIAQAAGCSKYHLTRAFRKATGMSPVEYAAKLRIGLAVKLLRSPELTVEEIAREVGYGSGSYFSKVFRSRTGFPPSEFREGRELPPFDRMMFD